MKRFFCTAVASLIGSQAFGMPGAFLASADGIIAIVYEPNVRNKLGDDIEISSVTRTKGYLFSVATGDCTLNVEIERYTDPGEPTPMVPKRRVKIGTLNCK